MTRRGVKQRPWTAQEDELLRANPDSTARELAFQLGRGYDAVQKRRANIGARPSHEGAKRNRRAYSIERRTLLAKTCTTCGLLLDADWYAKRPDDRWESRCRACRSRRNGQTRVEWKAAARERTAPVADRNDYEWTDADLNVLSRPDLSLLEMSTALGRTYTAVANARSYFGISRETPRLTQPREKWKIRANATS